eukprot:8530891-Heterocapsa_arctica.AAC.1
MLHLPLFKLHIRGTRLVPLLSTPPCPLSYPLRGIRIHTGAERDRAGQCPYLPCLEPTMAHGGLLLLPLH